MSAPRPNQRVGRFDEMPADEAKALLEAMDSMSAPRKIWAQAEHDEDPAYGSFWTRYKVAPAELYHHDDVVRELATLVAYLAGQNDDHVRVALAGNPDVCDGIADRARIALAKIAQEG